MIITQKIPHQLCSCCAAFVRQADCLRKTTKELLPYGYEYEMDSEPDNQYRMGGNPVMNIHSTYPTMHYIMQSGNRGCHLCSILTITIGEFAKVASRQALDEPIYTSLTLYPTYSNAIAAFCLRLHCGYPSSQIAGSRDNTKEACLIRRSENDLIVGCEDCDKCVNAQWNNASWSTAPGANAPGVWRSQSPNWLHARWTDHTASNLSFKMTTNWLDECLSSHPECGSKLAHQPPTRVLDINSLIHKHSVRLIPGTQLGAAQYATLSYRWGGYQEFMLTQENILSFQQGIPLSLFPRTLLEAVFVCRQLGIYFLWS